MKCLRWRWRDEQMGRDYRDSFFDSKRDWSKYKDSVLDYYLKPYLEKVKKLGRPICVVDMFAGRGEFKSGEPGSPLIIANWLKGLSERGYDVKLRCYENHPVFYEHLKGVLENFAFAEVLPRDCFEDVASIADLALTHTTLLYIDPFTATQLRFSKLSLIFEKVRQNSSVEALIIFMAGAFLRHAASANNVDIVADQPTTSIDPWLRDAEEDSDALWADLIPEDQGPTQKSKLNRELLDDIAGGGYWQAILDAPDVLWEERCARMIDGYRGKLRSWFRLTEALPVHPDTSAASKYWIVFASRYEPAFDLFNGAACKIVRSQAKNVLTNAGLFKGAEVTPATPAPQTVDRAVKLAAKTHLPSKWQELRWHTCGNRNVGRFTEGEVNQSIRRLLKSGWLSRDPERGAENESILSATTQLMSWQERPQ